MSETANFRDEAQKFTIDSNDFFARLADDTDKFVRLANSYPGYYYTTVEAFFRCFGEVTA